MDKYFVLPKHTKTNTICLVILGRGVPFFFFVVVVVVAVVVDVVVVAAVVVVVVALPHSSHLYIWICDLFFFSFFFISP